MVGIDDTFGESGTPKQLMEKYGLTSSNIVHACKKCSKKKNLDVKIDMSKAKEIFKNTSSNIPLSIMS